MESKSGTPRVPTMSGTRFKAGDYLAYWVLFAEFPVNFASLPELAFSPSRRILTRSCALTRGVKIWKNDP